MKITESKLRSIIKSVLSESDFMPEDYLKRDSDSDHREMDSDHREMDSSANMRRAMFCCDKMSKQELIYMCDAICRENHKMAIYCIKLCVHCCKGEIRDCCRCLDEICKCIHCEKVCSEYCRC